MGDTVNYLPIVIPFAVATIVGGIDCAESASAVGDHYSTGSVIAIEALATLLASFCGAVIQDIHRTLVTLLTRRWVVEPLLLWRRRSHSVAGNNRHVWLLLHANSKAAVYPILMFVGLEISAQSFLATPRRHYPAVAMACAPALAFLAMLNVGPSTPMTPEIVTTDILRNGFIMTSVFWSSALAMVIDRRMVGAAVFYFAAAFCTLFGVIHSPLAGAPIKFPFAFAGLPESWFCPRSISRL